MTLDDLKKIATSSLLLNLDRIIAPRLITIFYLLGMAAIILASISHLFFSFSLGFGGGLWGLLEILVFGLLAFVVLRVLCEAAIIFFTTHQEAVNAANHARPAVSLLDDVRDAIEELADENTQIEDTPPSVAKKPAPRRTAKRTPTKVAPANAASAKSTPAKSRAKKP